MHRAAPMKRTPSRRSFFPASVDTPSPAITSGPTIQFMARLPNARRLGIWPTRLANSSYRTDAKGGTSMRTMPTVVKRFVLPTFSVSNTCSMRGICPKATPASTARIIHRVKKRSRPSFGCGVAFKAASGQHGVWPRSATAGHTETSCSGISWTSRLESLTLSRSGRRRPPTHTLAPASTFKAARSSPTVAPARSASPANGPRPQCASHASERAAGAAAAAPALCASVAGSPAMVQVSVSAEGGASPRSRCACRSPRAQIA
mmetsp:Transcript_81213/g.248165  ORF Transcript_81213/g.248165 Transcript_81213/m.248165 type:complete len:261 (+) Transcript_81213:729-1511(+)